MEHEISLWSLYTWTEVEERASRLIAILPTGSIEQHGKCLPLGTDCLIVTRLIDETLKNLSKYRDEIIILPPLCYGCSEMWSGNPGTITIDLKTFIDLISQILHSIIKSSIKKVIILNGHAGNSEPLIVAIRNALNTHSAKDTHIYLINWWDLVNDIIDEIMGTEYHFMHADEIETSVALALDIPVKCICEEVEKPIRPLIGSKWYAKKFYEIPKIRGFTYEAKKYSSGCFGSPMKASRDKGKKIVEEFVERFINFINYVKRPGN